jgi:hypothetical protein
LKKILLFLLGINIVFASAAFGANGDSPFSVGEKLKFKIYAAGIYVGYQTIELSAEQKINGGETYVLKGLSKTAGFVSIFYRLNDKWTIYIDKNTYLPIRIEKEFVEGKSEGFYIYEIKQNDNLVILHNKETGEDKHIQSTNYVFDLFSLIYFFRNNPAVINETYTFDFLEPRRVRTVQFEDKGETEISIPRISSNTKISVREIKQVGGLGIRIYVSEDDLKLPLKMVTPAKLRKNKRLDVVFSLDRYSPGKDQKNIPSIYNRLK